jgi:hypothetical protein
VLLGIVGVIRTRLGLRRGRRLAVLAFASPACGAW